MPGSRSSENGSVAVVVPIKAFSRAKLRLAPALSSAERAELAREMAGVVIAAASPLPVTVVCDDEAVAAWARTRGARVAWTPGLGLNGAVAAGVAELAAAGWERVVVVHADLPLARDLGAVAGRSDRDVVAVPDRHDDGTNVLAVPADAGFRFSYGAGSFFRHQAEAVRLGLGVEVRRIPDLMWDVDVPADLALPGTGGPAPEEPAPCG